MVLRCNSTVQYEHHGNPRFWDVFVGMFYHHPTVKTAQHQDGKSLHAPGRSGGATDALELGRAGRLCHGGRAALSRKEDAAGGHHSSQGDCDEETS